MPSSSIKLLVLLLLLILCVVVHIAKSVKLKRLWLQDHCQETICSGIEITDNDYVIMSQMTIPKQFSLTFRNSTIAKIPHLLFETFPDLKELHLENCSTKSFDRPQFEGAGNIRKLYLGHNLLKDVPKNIFLGAESLRVLSLDHNRIVRLHNQSFSVLRDLQELNLEGNELQSLPRGVFLPLRKLESLNLSGNLLKFMAPDLFEENTKLLRINLARNRLQTFDSKWFHGQTRLHLLDVSGNALPELDLNISFVEKFIAQDCDLRQLVVHDGFITELELRNNTLTSIPYVLNAANLTTLDISGNPLRILEYNALGRFTGLLQLNLSFTGIDNLPDECFKSQSQLRMLDISGNSLYSLKFNVLHSLSALKYFYFQYNNWNCDFLQLLMNSFVKRRDISFMEDNIAPEVADDYVDGLACWFESNPRVTIQRSGGSSSNTMMARNDVSLEISLLRNDINKFKDSIESMFRKIHQQLEELKQNI